MACQSPPPASSPSEPPISPYPTIGSIQRLDPALDELIDPETPIEILAEGFEWSEGPVWVTELEAVLFSDIPNNAIFKWSEAGGKELYLKPAGYTGETARGGETGSNGLLLDAENNLVMCQHGDRRMARMDAPLAQPAANFVTLADSYEGKRFNSPNDAVFKSDGSLYFTDPPYGLEKKAEDPAKELDFQGVYRLTPQGEVQLLTNQVYRPNGIAFSPDEQTLYVANSDPNLPIWMAYEVNEDGSLGGARVFFDATEMREAGLKGLPDGMKVDENGNIFATGPGGVLIFSPSGKHLGTILTTEATANCGFGDDGSTLYMTADMYLLRVRLKTKG